MDIASVLSLTIALFCPLVIVGFGAMFSERSGIINLGLEGSMLFSALFGCLILQACNKSSGGVDTCIVPGLEQLFVFIAIIVSMISGFLFSLLLSFAAIKLKANQVITGTALNMIAPAFGMVFIAAVQSSTNTTVLVPSWTRIGISLVGENSFYRFLFSNLFLSTFVIIVLLIVLSIFYYKTKTGLRLRACGENPQAADSVGINVNLMRYLGTSISGACAGIGGLAYVLATSSGFIPEVGVSGYGFLALAVMIFGNWKPLGIICAALIFVFFRQIIIALPGGGNIKEVGQLYQLIPYLITIVALIIFSKRSHAPKAEGIPYDKSTR